MTYGTGPETNFNFPRVNLGGYAPVATAPQLQPGALAQEYAGTPYDSWLQQMMGGPGAAAAGSDPTADPSSPTSTQSMEMTPENQAAVSQALSIAGTVGGLMGLGPAGLALSVADHVMAPDPISEVATIDPIADNQGLSIDGMSVGDAVGDTGVSTSTGDEGTSGGAGVWARGGRVRRPW